MNPFFLGGGGGGAEAFLYSVASFCDLNHFPLCVSPLKGTFVGPIRYSQNQ